LRAGDEEVEQFVPAVGLEIVAATYSDGFEGVRGGQAVGWLLAVLSRA